MKTKLVYILTCTPESTYIEQALIAIWSARYHNPDSIIVLLTDNKTSGLLHAGGKRGEVLKYITEEKVITFDHSMTMHYRSRWLKSQVRELVDGDFLFIDCDTICKESLVEIDTFDALIAMVPDEHLRISDYPQCLHQLLKERSNELGYDIMGEEWYYNSGVIYAKDTPLVHEFWRCWHEIWKKGEKKGIKVDQPSLGKANIEYEHIIRRLPDVWNTLIYMNPIFADKGKILHFWNIRNKSFIFARPFLDYLKDNGLTEYAKWCILNPLNSVLPFDNVLTRSNVFQYIQFAKQIRKQRSLYAKNVDSTFYNFPWPTNYSLLRKYISINFLNRRKDVDVFFS